MPTETPAATVFYDEACPLCRAEIGQYRRQVGADSLCFVDVSTPGSAADQAVAPGLTRQQAMARFHVQLADGRLVSGAAGFVAVWETLPHWRWAARIARLPGVLPMLEVGYRMFLPIRPALSRAFAGIQLYRGRTLQ